MPYTVEIVVTAASGNVIATPRAGATGTAAVGGYAITQVDGMLHTITIAEALLGRWSLVAGDGNSQRLITFVSGVDDYYLDTGDSIKAKTDQLTFTVAGQVDANAQTGSAAFTVLPVSGAMVSRSRGTTIEVFTLETSTVSVAVTDSSGDAVDLEALTLEVVIEDMRTGDKSVIADGSLTKVTNTLSFAIPSAVSLTEANYEWSLRNTANDAVLVHGPFIVTYAPQSDP